ncbi:MAG: T9SS type A sorting domain-containing protein [Bacteroidota bacterium]|nr:T9SS type A sorting domain-containing protein [Bacteroidota bacterium]
MKKFTLMMSLVVLASFAFAQVVGVHAPTKDKVQKVKYNQAKGGEDVVWEVTFEEDPAVWTIAHDAGEADWTISDSTVTGVTFENGVDFTDEDLPDGTLVSSMWLYCGRRDVGVFSESGGNFAWIDGITDLLLGTEEIKNAWVQFDGLDMTGVDAPKLSFYQNYKALNSAFSYLDISLDGGATWAHELILNEDVEGNSYGDDRYEVILTDYIAGEANVSLRFRWQTTETSIGGYGYGWEIDDIKIVNNPDVDMVLKKGVMNFFDYVDYTDPANVDYFHISSHYGMLPEEQFEANAAVMVFNGIVESKGNLNITPDFNVAVFDPEMNEIYNETVSGANLSTAQVDTIDLLVELALDGAPYPALGEYTVVYNVVALDDAYEVDNNDTTFFHVTDEIYGRDLDNMISSAGPSNWLDGGEDGDMLATNYVFLYETTVETMDVYIAESSTAGTSMVAHVMQYDDGASDWVDIGTSDLIVVTEEMLGTWHSFTFPDPINIVPDVETSAFEVKAAVEFYYGSDEEAELVIGYDPTVNVSIWGASWYFTAGSNANSWLSLSNWSRGGLGIRLLTPTSHDAIAPINADNVNVYPNPTTGQITIENVRGADVEVFNLVGQRVYTATNMDQNMSIDLSNLSEGTYIVKISGTNTFKTQKINIVK